MNKYYRPQRTHINEQWQLHTHVSKAEGICMLSETKISAAAEEKKKKKRSHFLSLLKTLPQIAWAKV